MKKNLLFALFIAATALFSACGSSTDETAATNENEIELDTAKFLKDLADLEARIDHSLDIPSETDLKQAIVSFQDYAAIFPDDPKSPDYLLKASDFAHMLTQYEKSVKILDQIIANYPTYKKMEDVKYNRASHLDFELRDTTKAKLAYQTFIEEYPNSPLVSDCKSRIENIRYSLEELFEKFEAENAAGANQLP